MALGYGETGLHNPIEGPNDSSYRGGLAVLAGDLQLGVLIAVVSAEEEVQLPRFGVHRQAANKQRPHLLPSQTTISITIKYPSITAAAAIHSRLLLTNQ